MVDAVAHDVPACRILVFAYGRVLIAKFCELHDPDCLNLHRLMADDLSLISFTALRRTAVTALAFLLPFEPAGLTASVPVWFTLFVGTIFFREIRFLLVPTSAARQ